MGTEPVTAALERDRGQNRKRATAARALCRIAATGSAGMFKYAVIVLIVSLIAGAFGLTNVIAGERSAFRWSRSRRSASCSSRSWALPIWSATRFDRPALAPARDRIRINRA